ncbi:MAG: nuclear transport factor 2 family protein [Candidatus Pacebacteria bacterium]|nr:nuclear transport factor 2 family protein [Candidatus Paceibacterota bacterium]
MNITESEIKEFLKKYEDVTNSHVFSNVIGLVHSEAIYRFTDGDFVGIEAIQKAFENTWGSIKNETYSLSDLKIIVADSNSASITYTFNWSGIVDGVQKSGSGRGTNVIIRNGDKLQFIHEHLSK